MDLRVRKMGGQIAVYRMNGGYRDLENGHHRRHDENGCQGVGNLVIDLRQNEKNDDGCRAHQHSCRPECRCRAEKSRHFLQELYRYCLDLEAEEALDLIRENTHANGGGKP